MSQDGDDCLIDYLVDWRQHDIRVYYVMITIASVVQTQQRRHRDPLGLWNQQLLLNRDVSD